MCCKEEHDQVAQPDVIFDASFRSESQLRQDGRASSHRVKEKGSADVAQGPHVKPHASYFPFPSVSQSYMFCEDVHE